MSNIGHGSPSPKNGLLRSVVLVSLESKQHVNFMSRSFLLTDNDNVRGHVVLGYFLNKNSSFLANVNLCSVVHVRYMLSTVRLSSVTIVHPTQAVEIFGNISTA